jgi:alpha-galactosidase
MRVPLRLAFPMLLAGAGAAAPANPDGLALTPPMGWNSWNKFGCDVSEKLIRGAADALVATGMKDAGYQYVVIDDCWQVKRDDKGMIVPDPERFSSGMKALADYVHGKGLKFGLYSDAGTGTCQNRPGSKGHEEVDARTYAEWGVDYLKYDWCNANGQDTRDSYARMSRALRGSGRPIVFSICEWGSTSPWLWAQGIGQLWRSTGDIQDCWDCGKSWGGLGVVHIIDLQADLHPWAGPGHWNDPDMLEVGNGGMSDDEYRTHMSLWSILAAPLLAGNDIRDMKPEIAAILMNKEVLAVNQDKLGKQGARVAKDGDTQVWSKPLAGGGFAVGLFNLGDKPATMTAKWTDLGIAGAHKIRDLWKHEDIGGKTGEFAADVPSHGVVMVKIAK